MTKLDYVNARIGTDNEPRFSNGNIVPLTACPWGMAAWCIQTEPTGNWFYSPNHRVLEGIRLTHQPSPWIGDYGHLLVRFTNGTGIGEHSAASSFRPEEAVIAPDYIRFDALRYQTRVECTPTERGGAFRIRCRKDKSFAVLQPFGEFAWEQLGPKTLRCRENTTYRWGQAGLDEYFYIAFSCDITGITELPNGGIALELADTGYEMRIATSFISPAQAEHNYRQELAERSFEQIRVQTQERWERLLGRVELSGESPEQQGLFYSCMYRVLLFPRKFHETTPDGRVMHFNPDAGRAFEGVFYTDNGFWDTYRTVYPLLSLLCPEAVTEMAEGFMHFYEETGWLPRWISPGECGLMPGTLVEAVIADGAVKGLLSADLLERAYEGMVKNATVSSGNDIQGRKLPEIYEQLGYLPMDRVQESINHTLDCAYGDFCISQVAGLLGKTEEQQFFLNRSKNYRNIFDARYGFMLGRDSAGRFEKDFEPTRWGGANCEGSYWQNSFGVYHDVEGLARLYGGNGQLAKKLDELFATPPVFEIGSYPFEIHEMSEMAAADFGQCAISNQPSFHIPWLYTLLGQKEKTCFWTEKLAREAFSNSTRGFPGDEDNGTTAAWYIFACLGFYPVCPGKPEFVLSVPLVNAQLHLKDGRTCSIQKGACDDRATVTYEQLTM